MGGGHTQALTVAPTPSLPTRDSSDVQALQAQQSKRYANPNTFSNSILSYSSSNSNFNTTGSGSNLLGG